MTDEKIPIDQWATEMKARIDSFVSGYKRDYDEFPDVMPGVCTRQEWNEWLKDC